jgi:putative drug exporter of the RND superfamily
MSDLSQTAGVVKPGAVARVSLWVRAHRRLVIVGWVALLVVAMAASQAAGTRYVNNLSLPGTDSQRATNLLNRQFRAQAGDVDQLVLHSTRGQISDPALGAQIAGVLSSVAHLCT